MSLDCISVFKFNIYEVLKSVMQVGENAQSNEPTLAIDWPGMSKPLVDIRLKLNQLALPMKNRNIGYSFDNAWAVDSDSFHVVVRTPTTTLSGPIGQLQQFLIQNARVVFPKLHKSAGIQLGNSNFKRIADEDTRPCADCFRKYQMSLDNPIINIGVFRSTDKGVVSQKKVEEDGGQYIVSPPLQSDALANMTDRKLPPETHSDASHIELSSGSEGEESENEGVIVESSCGMHRFLYFATITLSINASADPLQAASESVRQLPNQAREFLQCPECNYTTQSSHGTNLFLSLASMALSITDSAGLNIHKARKHGKCKSKTVQKPKTGEDEPVTCKLCGYVAKSQRGTN